MFGKTDMKFLESSLRLSGLGWHVFPLATNSKLPAISKEKEGGQGVLDATTDETQLRDWARRYPRANVGIACGRVSGITVIDVDPRHGGNQTMVAFKAKNQHLTPTVLSRTPSGGYHVFYAFESALLNSQNLLGPGIDVRTTGGYVVAPPSVAGSPYSWINPPLGSDLPRMPQWAVERLRPKPAPVFQVNASRDTDDGLRGLLKFLENAKSGERNKCLYWAARRAAEGGFTDARSADALMGMAVQIGLTPDEARKTLGSGFKSGRRIA